MNSIETIFYDAFHRFEEIENGSACDLEPQKTIGIYKVDFVYESCAIEIDGYDYHKTKEQREYDYNRERYLLKNGYTPIRFTGTEVFLDPDKCVREMHEIAEKIHNVCIENYKLGISHKSNIGGMV